MRKPKGPVPVRQSAPPDVARTHTPQTGAGTDWQQAADASPVVQRLMDWQHKADASVAQRQTGPSQGLPEGLRTGVESLSGLSLDGVRVHHNSPEPARIGARAYARGSDIHLASGQERHLPHEAWHVVQQAQGRVRPTGTVHGTPVNASPGLEAEADRMGTRALQRVARDDTGTPATLRPLGGGSGGSGGGPVQGKFGFEIETRIMAMGSHEGYDSIYSADRAMAKDPYLAHANGFDVHIDHLSKFKSVPGNDTGAIIELVTNPPFDETRESEEGVAAKMRAMAKTATTFESHAAKPHLIEKYPGITATGAKPKHEIFPGHFSGKQGQTASGYMQVTYGTKLAAVPLAFEHLATDEVAHTPKDRDRFATAATVSGTVIENVLERAKQKFPKREDEIPEGFEEIVETRGRDAEPLVSYHHTETNTFHPGEPDAHDTIDHDFKELRGLLALLANYLLATTSIKVWTSGLLKNKIGQVFYKTKLSTVRNQLRGYANTALLFGEFRTVIKAALLQELNLKADQKLVPVNFEGLPPTPTVMDYMEQVLTGKSDFVFDASINPFSSELTDQVGETGREAPAVIMENRRVKRAGDAGLDHAQELLRAFQRMQQGGNSKDLPPGEWEDYARQYYKAVKALNKPVPEAPD